MKIVLDQVQVNAIYGIQHSITDRLSICLAPEQLNVKSWYYKWWKKTIAQVDALDASEEIVLYNTKNDSH